MKFSIFGSGDDLVEFRGCVHGECDIGIEEDAACYVKVGDDARGTLVTMRYSPADHALPNLGCWVATVAPLGECVPMFDCAVGMDDHGYSTRVTFDVPDGTPVTVLSGDSDEWVVPS